MRDERRVRPTRAGSAAVAMLAACAAWLAVQNTLLVAALLWVDPRRAGLVLKALARGAVAVAAALWSEPEFELLVSGALLAAALVCAAVVLAAKTALAAAAGRGEAHRG